MPRGRPKRNTAARETATAPAPAPRGRANHRPQLPFAYKLVLNQWLLSLFNVRRFEELAEHLRNEALEGLDENNFLEEEGLPTNDDRGEFLLPVIKNLGVPRPEGDLVRPASAPAAAVPGREHRRNQPDAAEQGRTPVRRGPESVPRRQRPLLQRQDTVPAPQPEQKAAA